MSPTRSPSWPGLSRPFTSLAPLRRVKTWMPATSAGMTARAAILALAALLPQGAAAQDKYPSRPITMIVPFPAGGGGDAVARIVAHELGGGRIQPIIPSD